MTINSYPPYVSFGDFQPLSRSLWILYRTLEEVEENQNNASLVKQRLREEICFVMSDLYNECIQLNVCLLEFNFLCQQIREKNQAINPIPFDWERHAYRNHISNCFILDHEFY